MKNNLILYISNLNPPNNSFPQALILFFSIHARFKISIVNCHDKYLGLPTMIGRSKKRTFAMVKKRVWNKLKSQKEKLLSKFDKDILIKEAIQSILSYMMSYFKITQSLYDDIHSMIAKFLWGCDVDNNGVHWVSWEKLCLPKVIGGMGFSTS